VAVHFVIWLGMVPINGKNTSREGYILQPSVAVVTLAKIRAEHRLDNSKKARTEGI
jgi:hypothetical protein